MLEKLSLATLQFNFYQFNLQHTSTNPWDIFVTYTHSHLGRYIRMHCCKLVLPILINIHFTLHQYFSGIDSLLKLAINGLFYTNIWVDPKWVQGFHMNPSPRSPFLNNLWKWNNLVSVKPISFFMGYLRKMRWNQQSEPTTPLYIWTLFPEIRPGSATVWLLSSFTIVLFAGYWSTRT